MTGPVAALVTLATFAALAIVGAVTAAASQPQPPRAAPDRDAAAADGRSLGAALDRVASGAPVVFPVERQRRFKLVAAEAGDDGEGDEGVRP